MLSLLYIIFAGYIPHLNMSDNHLKSGKMPEPGTIQREKGESEADFKKRLQNLEEFQLRTGTVVENEKIFYLRKRRQLLGLPEPTDDNLTGLCISGGGVRSATLGLGMLQALMTKGKLKMIDYLSTVSGGGFIGSCFTSLLSNEHPWDTPKDGPLPENKRFDGAIFGVDKENSPFLSNPGDYEYQPLEKTRLTPKHQLSHLRRHGEYLTPRKGIFSWDVSRAIGALFSGVFINFAILALLISVLVLVHHVLLGSISNNKFIYDLRHAEVFENMQRDKFIKADILNQISRECTAVDTTSAHEAGVTKRALAAALDSLTSHPAYFQPLESAVNGGHPDAIFPFRHDSALDSLVKKPVALTILAKSLTLKDTIASLETLKNQKSWEEKSEMERIDAWFTNRFSLQVNMMYLALLEEYWLALIFIASGFLGGVLVVWFSIRYPYQIAQKNQEEQVFDGTTGNYKNNRLAGDDLEYFLTRHYRKLVFFMAVLAGPALSFLTVGIMHNYLPQEFTSHYGYMVFLSLPCCFNLGMFLGALSIVSFGLISAKGEKGGGRLYRNFYHGIEGRVLTGLLISLAFPFAILLLLGKHGLIVYILLSLLPVATAYYFTLQGLASRGEGKSVFKLIAQRVQQPLLNLSIFLFLAFAFSLLSSKIYFFELQLQAGWNYSFTQAALLLLGIVMVLVLISGFVVNFNDLSLHYFYRDRLAEAYLRTNGRVERPNSEDGIVRTKDLFEVNLRNHDNLPLMQMGEGNMTGPYHLIVAALNLQASHDLAKRSLKSDHFIFSKYYIGSRTTGYYRTDKYVGGTMRLSTAMTISAAAISSGMGALGFAASNFYMTLFNLRTGYWIFNPSYEFKLKQLKDKIEAAKREKRKAGVQLNFNEWWSLKFPKATFWLGYLASEMSGRLTSNDHRVYVSDGGHTGDNLGLLPLIQRRCKTIIIADFEEDEGFTFGSFNQAIRLANVIYDAKIEIDLSPLMPKKNDAGNILSVKSVVKGKVIYANGKKADLIYMKSCMNLTETTHPTAELNPRSPKTPVDQQEEEKNVQEDVEQMPAYVLNYLKTNPTFPHQTTSDQYFDEVQFEAYRMLGEHIGRQSVELMS